MTRRLAPRPLAAGCVAAALALGLAGPVAAQNDNDQQPAGAGYCRSDRFFVHVPTWAPADVQADFDTALAARMRTHVASRGALSGSVTVEPVLDVRARVVQRADGHRRFWIVKSDPVPAGEVCRWLDTLRAGARQLAGDDVYVGRECTAGGLAAPGSPDWPLEVMGVPSAPREAPAPIAVIDSGFAASPTWTAPGIAPASPRHPHGSMVAAAITQLTASARTPSLLDYRALDRDGSATLADVARAIDAAVFDAEGPRVINLSVGWPPELERRRAELGCATPEDPAGEAVRYTLAMAHLRDAGQLTAAAGHVAPAGATPVVVAAGNRPTLYGEDVTPFYATHHRVIPGPLAGDCSQPGGDGLFYPAQWARRRTCLALGSGVVTIDHMRVTPVGATDHRDQRSPLSAAEMTPLLVAPGVAVRLDGDRWSGSSIATAYASAAVSLELGRRATDGAAAVAAVYDRSTPLSGIGTPLPVRRLRFVGSHTAAPPVYVTGGRAIDGSRAVAVPGPDRLACLSALTAWMRSPTPVNSAAVAAACPAFLTALDRFSAGEAGPQPPTIGCPECYGVIDLTREVVDLHVTLTTEWDTRTTTISDPYLVVSYPDGYESWLPLPGSATDWRPGGQFTLEELPLTDRKSSTVSDLTAKGSMSLVMTVTQWGKASTDVSVVVMK